MAVYRYGFDIHRPNPALGLRAAGLGEQMRANRALEGQRQAVAERQARQDEIAAGQRKRDAERAALSDTWRVVQYMQGLEESQRPQAWASAIGNLSRLHGEEMMSTVPSQYDPAVLAQYSATLAPFAEQMKDTRPASVREAEWYKNASEEDRAAFDAAQAAGASRTTIDTSGIAGLVTDQPVTDEVAARFGISPENAGKYVIRKGQLSLRDQPTAVTTRERLVAERRAGAELVKDAWQDYMEEYQNAPRLGGVIVDDVNTRTRLNGLRAKLVSLVSQATLGKFGTEPSPVIREEAESIVPEWEGRGQIGFQGAMEALLSRNQRDELRREGGEDGGGAQADETQADETQGQVPAVTNREEYNAIPSGAQYRDPQGNVRRKP